MVSAFKGFRFMVFSGIPAGILFAALLCFRLGLFEKDPVVLPSSHNLPTARETWMTVFQSDRKIGTTHQRLVPKDTGYELSDQTVMRINTMGLVQDIRLETSAGLNADLSLSSFQANLSSSRFSFSVQGKVIGNILKGSTKTGAFEMPLSRPLYITAGIWDVARSASLKEGETVTYSFFDPISLTEHPVQVTYKGRVTLRIDGGDQPAGLFTVETRGVVESAWIDDTGDVLQETGLLGLTLKKTTREQALAGSSLEASEDLTKQASVAAGAVLEDPKILTTLVLKIEGVPPSLVLDGDRQSFSDHFLTITREDLPDPSEIQADAEVADLAATPFIQSDEPEIRDAAKAAVKTAARPLAKARNLVAWVYEHIEKRPVLSVPSALETLRTRRGDCNEHAVLLAALARAAGIPARVEAGLVYMDGRFYYHAWNSLYLGTWVTADALMNQFPADVTHIRLVRGETGEQANILGAIGNLSIQIIGKTP